MVDKTDIIEKYEENIYWLTHEIRAWKDLLKNANNSFDKFKKAYKGDCFDFMNDYVIETNEKDKNGYCYFISIYKDDTDKAIMNEIKNHIQNLEEDRIEAENHLYFTVRFYDEFDNMMNKFIDNHKEDEYNMEQFLEDYFYFGD